MDADVAMKTSEGRGNGVNGQKCREWNIDEPLAFLKEISSKPMSANFYNK